MNAQERYLEALIELEDLRIAAEQEEYEAIMRRKREARDAERSS